MSGEVSDVQSIGTNVELQELAMGAWNGTGVLTAIDKQVLNKPEVTELGIRIDGKKALLGCSPERLLKTAFATIFHWRNAVWSKKEAQIILGRWIFILQFRRAAMSCLSRAWETVEKPWPSALDRELLNGELATLLCLGPLLQTDLTSQYDGQVTCSDASGSGGAAAMACDLTWSGRSLLGRLSDRRLQALPIPVLVVSLFNGIGGAFRLYDVLGLQPQGRISVDISRCGNRVTRTTWPGVIELHDICSLNRGGHKGMVKHLSQHHGAAPIRRFSLYSPFLSKGLSSKLGRGRKQPVLENAADPRVDTRDFFDLLQSQVLCGKCGLNG